MMLFGKDMQNFICKAYLMFKDLILTLWFTFVNYVLTGAYIKGLCKVLSQSLANPQILSCGIISYLN